MFCFSFYEFFIEGIFLKISFGILKIVEILND